MADASLKDDRSSITIEHEIAGTMAQDTHLSDVVYVGEKGGEMTIRTWIVSAVVISILPVSSWGAELWKCTSEDGLIVYAQQQNSSKTCVALTGPTPNALELRRQLNSCNDAARTQQLGGDERVNYVRECLHEASLALVGVSTSADTSNDEERRKSQIKLLHSLNTEEFCVAFGQGLRYRKIQEIHDYNYKEAEQLVKAEAKRRKLNFNLKLVEAQEFHIGASVCDLYAALGFGTRNRTVSSRGVSIQHVYGSLYVYTSNGRVTSWQD